MAAKNQWVHNLFNHLLSRQGGATALVSAELRMEGRGRKGKLIIKGDGPNEDVSRYFRWTGSELVGEEDGRGCQQVIAMHQDTLLDIALGEIEVRTAMAAGLLSITGSRALYNREELLQLISRLGNWIQSELKAAGHGP